MKFEVRRASNRFNDKPPVEGAQAEKIEDDLEDELVTIWTLEVATLEGLMQLMEQVNEDIVVRLPRVRKLPELVIYDDYLE